MSGQAGWRRWALVALFIVAAVLGAGVSALPGARADLPLSVWVGTWSTSRGTVVLALHPGGLSLDGTFNPGNGLVSAHRGSMGWTDSIEGSWTEPPTPTTAKKSGSFYWKLSADLRSFKGEWWTERIGDGGAWNGTRIGPPPATTTTRTTTAPVTTTRPTTTGKDTTPPAVKAYPLGGVLRPGTRAAFTFSVTDDSGKAQVHIGLYDGGTPVRTVRTVGLTSAGGAKHVWNVVLAADLKGPLFFCVWARDAAGNTSARAPTSSCVWASFLVAIGRVSNGCGGAPWDTLQAEVEWWQNYVANTSSYTNSVNPLGRSYEVSFVEACNLHDAAYAGATVADTIHGGVVDFRRWSRKQVDDKFWSDMRILCQRQIPASATTARRKCLFKGGVASFGAESRYNFVRDWGHLFFDADLTAAGKQKTGSPNSRPPGGVRENN